MKGSRMTVIMWCSIKQTGTHLPLEKIVETTPKIIRRQRLISLKFVRFLYLLFQYLYIVSIIFFK